jgi:Fe-Mn family superoxide dismutase
MFWQIMSPTGKREPSGQLAKAIEAKFGSFDEFKNAFTQAGLKVFGSGWVWLVLDKSANLDIMTTANQDSPLLSGFYPIMGNDVWEHAYYLKYRNLRAEYLKQWWNVVNWEEVSRRYLQAQKAA